MSSSSTKLVGFENRLHAGAACTTGLSDFGPSAYREGLRVLLDAFEADLQLTDQGWETAYVRLLPTLEARLYTQQGWRDHPRVLNGPIDRPIVITGLPRSGTTALHKLMSVDPQFQGLESWLLEAPMIRPPRGSWEHHYRYRSSVARIDALNANIPSFRRVHETIPFEVEECTLALMQSFVSSVWSESYVVPTYAQWLSRQSDDVAYLRHADILRLIGANEMRKRWLLKSPHHMYHIEALLSVFPDACIIQTHRDPLDAIPSVCSLAYTYWRDLEGKVSWREKMGLWKCAHWKAALDRMQSVRTSSSVQGQFFDVDHRRFLADPLEVVRSIYEYFVLRLSPSVERSMKDRIMRNPTARHGKHQYNVDICGATGAQIREIFADYRRQNQFD